MKERVFEQFPFVDVAFGPGQIDKLGEFLTSDDLVRPGVLRVRGLSRPPADEARAPVPGMGPDLGRLQQRLLVLHRPVARVGGSAAGGRPSSSPRSRRSPAGRGPGGHAARPERELVRARPFAGRADRLRRAARARRRRRRNRPDPLHEPAPQGHARERDRRPRRAAGALRAHPPAAAVRVEPDPQGDAAHIRPRALHEARRDDPRRTSRTARSRPTSSSASPARPRTTSGRRSRSSRRSATTPRSRSSSRRAGEPRRPACRPGSPRRQARADGAARRARPAARARAQPAASSERTQEVLVEGPSRTDPARLRGRTRHNKTVNFDGAGRPGRVRRRCEITGATSTTLAGEELLAARVA